MYLQDDNYFVPLRSFDLFYSLIMMWGFCNLFDCKGIYLLLDDMICKHMGPVVLLMVACAFIVQVMYCTLAVCECHPILVLLGLR